jgi:threonine/homoserine/homoserine lactone efflux protein
MPAPAAVVAFVLATLAFLLIPGPAVLFVVTRSIEQGRRAGLASVSGGAFGNLVHVCAATLGVSAIVASSAVAYSVVKYLGAAYLIYLGLRTLLTRDAGDMLEVGPRRSLRRIMWQGFLVYALHPKTALFFLAFLPQFTDPARGPVATQLFVLGSLFVLMSLITDGGYALLAGTLGGWLRTSVRVRRVQRYVSGSVYLALGVTAAMSGQRK